MNLHIQWMEFFRLLDKPLLSDSPKNGPHMSFPRRGGGGLKYVTHPFFAPMAVGLCWGGGPVGGGTIFQIHYCTSLVSAVKIYLFF